MEKFDTTLENHFKIPPDPPQTIGQLLFTDKPGRSVMSPIIYSHIDSAFTGITLEQLRQLVSGLIQQFDAKGINYRETVAVLNFSGCNEMLTAILFTALVTNGCRVFLPMYSETAEFEKWLEMAEVRHIIAPAGEVLGLEGHDREKNSVQEIREIAEKHGIPFLDTQGAFKLREAVERLKSGNGSTLEVPEEAINRVLPGDDALIITTSGTTGQSKMVVYDHEAYYLNCLAWEQAGFYHPDKLGGTGFTPLFTHTMGIRAYINALWTGTPVCLIITEWFTRKPEIVRYLLLKMKPAHVTGGPAIYNAFIELYRQYPELKSSLNPCFKTLVSSGAGYNPQVCRAVWDAIGLKLNNAFGTSETQQAFSTLLSDESILEGDLVPLGKPLPGITARLIPSETGEGNYRLFIHSLFGHKYCIGEPGQDPFFDTGDLVQLTEEGALVYVGREAKDYFKDNFGVKVPVRILKEYYKECFDAIRDAEFFPVVSCPGISALLFIDEPRIPTGIVSQQEILKRYAGTIEGINDRLKMSLEPFEFSHRHISRIALINETPPLTGKGTVSVREIRLKYGDLIERLQDPRKDASSIELTESHYLSTDKYSRYISPQIGDLLSALKMNIVYHGGKKDSLLTYLHGREEVVLDFAGGYGSNLLGHSNPGVKNAMLEFLSRGQVAINNQLSIPHYAGMLAERLNLLVGEKTGKAFKVLLCNSGAEAVEMALHHALFEWRHRLEKLRDMQIQAYGSSVDVNAAEVWKKNFEVIEQATVNVIALKGAYHGHTSGARASLWNRKKRIKFSNLEAIETLFLDDLDPDWQEKAEEILKNSTLDLDKVVQHNGHATLEPFRISRVIAALAEPVIGEGGVRIVHDDVLGFLSRQEFPLIADEIQCGLGRTGTLPVCKEAHYYLFAKSLGGGMEKIGAVLIDSQRFRYDFSEYYVSTFGNGELAAYMGLKVVDIIQREKIPEKAATIGGYLKRKMEEVAVAYPSIIQRITGEGVMLGIAFNPKCADGNVMLRAIFNSEKAGYLFSAWLFHRHRIRVFPTLSAPETLRLEPSAFLTESEADQFCLALDELCSILKERRLYDLFRFLMDDDPFDDNKGKLPDIGHYQTLIEEPAAGAQQVAFIAHFVNPINELRMLEPDLCKASDTGLRLLFNRMELMMDCKPFRLIANNLFNGRVHFSFYVLPVDSAELEHLHKTGKSRRVVAKIQEAVELAAANGAKVISLGGYTSILTRNGLAIAEPTGTRIITGNTLTAASGIYNLKRFSLSSTLFNKKNRIAIIGASGNIGRVITETILQYEEICGSLHLIAPSSHKMEVLMQEIGRENRAGVVVTSGTQLTALRDADIVIVCTNTNDPLVFPHHVAKDKPVLISDLSVPSAVAQQTVEMHNVTSMPFAAYISLPQDPQAVISSYSAAGTVFCCAAEVMLLGLEPFPLPLKGPILADSVKGMMELATRHHLFDHVGTIKSYKK